MVEKQGNPFAHIRVLLVEDDQKAAEAMANLLRGWGLTVAIAGDGAAALEMLPSFVPHLAITDLMMPTVDGFELLASIAEKGYRFPVIVLTGLGKIEVGLKVVHDLGAFWFLEKPVRSDVLRALLERAVAQNRLVEDTERLRRELSYRGSLGGLAGKSRPMQEVFALVRQVAPTTAPVLITGESGTGKELVARAIHELSARSNGPFVPVNCAALPETLMESELFGHEKGAFTGALTRRAGCFELANGGTLLLDEIGEMPLGLQAKLLRVLEDSRVRPLGAASERPVDVRIVASTNRKFDELQGGGRMRTDLYHRLNVFQVYLPPLRERSGDLPLLVESLIASLNKRHGCQVQGVDRDVLSAFEMHAWPGNVRELRNILERAVIVAGKGMLTMEHLPAGFAQPVTPREDSRGVRLPFGTTLKQGNDALIAFTLAETNNNKRLSAKILGISVRALFDRLQKRSKTAAGGG